MTDLKYDSTTYITLIEELEQRISLLMEQEMQEKLQQQQLIQRVTFLEAKNTAKNKKLSQLD